MTLSEVFFGEAICDTADLQTIINYCYLPFQSILSFFACYPSEFQALVCLSSAKMKENPTAKYIKFWFCVTFSALSFNRRHLRSGNDNLTYLSKLSLLYAFQANSCCCLNTSSFSFNVSTIFLVCFCMILAKFIELRTHLLIFDYS